MTSPARRRAAARPRASRARSAPGPRRAAAASPASCARSSIARARCRRAPPGASRRARRCAAATPAAPRALSGGNCPLERARVCRFGQLVLASASCGLSCAAGSRVLGRGGPRWLPSTAAAVFGYVHRGCLVCGRQLKQYPPFACSAPIDDLSLTPPRQLKKRRVRGLRRRGPAPGLVAIRVWAPWARPRARWARGDRRRSNGA